ncbi:vacuolar-sorting protein SNF8 [Babesia caballi]|uniref:Vacuolar-sorting protein SNF8 n=1 Tax=Babesia caballi TaxID=5871 RepID=A0AAV4LTT3_BABCB|nr:vacuolar-sorting protein SNF8 [Babesia caballi]
MRRGIGASRMLNHQSDRQRWDSFSQSLERDTIEAYGRFAEELRAKLYNFVEKYKELINDDPSFRLQFLELCDLLGVDPLTHSLSRFSKILGLSRFYASVTVRVLDVCIKTRALNGGFCEMSQVLAAFPAKSQVTEADILRCIAECSVFGENSIRTMQMGGKTIIITTPVVLGSETRECLNVAASIKRGITVGELSTNMQWTEEKAQNLLYYFTQRQIAWIDNVEGETYYWFPCLL